MPKNSKKPPYRLNRDTPETEPHRFRRNRVGNLACTVCGLRKIITRAGDVFFTTRSGHTSVNERRCAINVMARDRAVLDCVQGVLGGLTAAQLVVLLNVDPVALRATLHKLRAARYLNLLGAIVESASYELGTEGARYLAARNRKKLPRGRPRKYAPGEAPKSYYKPTGRPMGRPRKRGLVAEFGKVRGRVGRPAVFDDEAHRRARASTRRWRNAKRTGIDLLPRKTIASLTPQERAERVERLKARARVIARSWRRWRSVTALAARHVAASPPEPDELSVEARAWLRQVAR